MAEEFYEGDSVSITQPLPSPSGTPYETPLLGVSRRSSSRATPTSSAPLTPTGLPLDDLDDTKTARRNENISRTDEDAFTPTLHASLVSEILSLRREIESKTGFIERLETSLSESRSEKESLQESLNKSSKETRSVRRQLQSIEDGTLSALEDIAKERDEAQASAKELKKRLDNSQDRLKTQQDNTERNHKLWEHEKSAWGHQKGMLERRAKVAESRLKQVLQEFAAREAAVEQETQLAREHFEQDIAALPQDVQSSPVAKVKAHARARSSVSSLASLRKAAEENGGMNKLSLADELESGDIEDDEMGSEPETDPFTKDSRVKSARLSREMNDRVDEAMRVLGVPSITTESANQGLDLPTPISEERELEAEASLEPNIVAEGKVDPIKYTIDMGDEQMDILNNTPMNDRKPEIAEINDMPTEPTSFGLGNATSRGFGVEQADQHAEIEANQRRKRDPLKSPVNVHTRAKSDPSPQSPKRATIIETSLPSPPGSPESIEVAGDGKEGEELPEKPVLVSVATQTDISVEEAQAAEIMEDTPPVPTRAPPSVPVAIPSIEIHPPDSTTPSPNLDTARRLGIRDMGCQTESLPSPLSRSFGMQTEAIRVDQRSVKLPPHLLPSAISSEPPSAEKGAPRSFSEGDITKTRPEYYGSESLPSTPTLPPLEESENEDGSPGKGLVRPSSVPGPSTSFIPEEDDARSSWARIKKSLILNGRHSKIIEPDNIDDIEDGVQDSIDRDPLASSSRLLSKRQQKMTKPFDPPTPVLENERATVNRSSMHSRATTSAGSRSSFERARKAKSTSYTYRPPPPIPKSIKTSRSQRSGSPGATSVASSSNWSKTSGPPPFVIPTRSSSKTVNRRKRNDGPSSPTPRSSASSPKRRDGRSMRTSGLRKSRSEIALPEGMRIEKPPTPATPLSITSFGSDDKVPPMPGNVVSLKKLSQDARSSSSQSWNVNSVVPTGNAYVGASVQHTVVDAIAATMVGEWMYKYTRKRKSFGVSDNPQDFSKPGDARHKRWVWVSPHERTVLWSNRQPTSNSALMGKNGRKLPIQSVLDVKDDAAAPKGVDSQKIFNRSILVLTPTRALKFTAIARERHYLWLTALSFLAHHTSQGILDLSFLPAAPPSAAPADSQPESRSRSRSNSVGCTSAGNSRKHWSLSKQSSGYATPAIPESDAIAPRPASRAAAAFQNGDHQSSQAVPEEAAFAPAIPRVPHSRKRSASGPSGVTTIRGTTSLRGLQSANASFMSSNQSTRSAAVPGPLSSNPTLPAPPRNSKSGSSSMQNMRQQSNSPIVDEEDEREDNEIRGIVSSVEAARLTFANPKNSIEPDSPSFGGNSSFFDAVVAAGNTVRLDAFAGPGIRNIQSAGASLPSTRPPTGAAPRRKSQSRNGGIAGAAVESAREERISHSHGLSYDSVAPPNIQKVPPMPERAPPPTPSRKPFKKRSKGLFGGGKEKTMVAAK